MATSHPQPAAGLAPDWLPHRYDAGHDAVHMITADRALRRSAPFLIDEHLPGAADPRVLRRIDVMAAAPKPAPVNFIFHSAYCCSTLLANAFDRAGASSAMKEPQILNDLVGWRQRGGDPKQLAVVLDNAMTLLARPFEPGERVVIKPSNVVNGIASAMLAMRPEAGCVLLYAPLPLFLASIADKGMWGRLWVRDLLVKQLKDNLVADLGFEPHDHLLQTDLQAAAVGWLAQHRLFGQLAARWPDRVRTLNSEELLDRPEEAMARIATLFGVPLEPVAIDEIVSGVFRRDAKFGHEFSREDRIAQQRARGAVHAEEVEKVSAWASEVARNAGVDMTPPGDLFAA